MRPIVTVSNASSSKRLVSLEYAKEVLNISGVGSDDLLQGFIDGASSFIAGYCNQSLVQATISELWRIRHPVESLFLTRFLNVDIMSITEDGTTLAANVDYEFDDEAAELFRLDGNDCRRLWWSYAAAGKVIVEYTAGFSPADDTGSNVPDDLRDACLSLLKTGWFARTRDPMIKAEDIFQISSTQYWVGALGDGGLPADIALTLDNYSRQAVG